MIIILGKIAAVGVAFMLLNKQKGAKASPEEIVYLAPIVDPELPLEEIEITEPVPVPMVKIPGSFPEYPISSKLLTPDFKGWFQVQTGDTLSAIMVRLGRAKSSWPELVSMSQNQWAVKLCTRAVRTKYYGGKPGITLTKQYGTKPGVDCVSQGYGPGFPLLKTSNGAYPVLYWG